MLAVFNFFQTIGFFGFGNWVPKLISGQGISVSDSLLYAALIAIANPAGPFIFTVFADKFERKWQIVAAAVGTAAFGLLFTLQKAAWGIVLVGVLITLTNNLMSYSYHTYQAEVFPTRIRARAVGFVYAFSRLSTIFTSFMIAFFTHNFGNPGTFVFISLSMLVAAAAIAFFGPLTRGRSLEEKRYFPNRACIAKSFVAKIRHKLRFTHCGKWRGQGREVPSTGVGGDLAQARPNHPHFGPGCHRLYPVRGATGPEHRHQAGGE